MHLFACCTCNDRVKEQDAALPAPQQLGKEESDVDASAAARGLDEAAADALVDAAKSLEDAPAPDFKPAEVPRRGTPLTVQIEKPRAAMGLGLGLDVTPGAPMHIYDIVSGGPVSKYNEHVSEHLEIQVGSYLMAINGVRGDAVNVLGEVGKTNTNEVELQRPHVWTVTVERRTMQEHLGLDLDFADTSRSLLVSGLKAGVVCNFNAGHPASAIRVKDRILAVNGSEGSPAKLMSMLASNPVTLKLSRPEDPAD